MEQYEVRFNTVILVDANNVLTSVCVRERDQEELDNIFITMAKEQNFDIDEVALGDLVGVDVVAEIQEFISCCERARRKFEPQHLMTVVNGHYPKVSGLDVYGLYHTDIRLEVETIYKPWDQKEKISEWIAPLMKKEEAFILFFREFENRYTYSNDTHVTIIDEDLAKEYRSWISDIGNYARHGGRMD